MEQIYQAGEVIYRAGDPNTSAFVILSGKAEVSFELNGKTIEVEVEPGDIIGDTSIVFSIMQTVGTEEYKGTATALETVHAATMPLDTLKAELAEASPLLRGWLISFVDRSLKTISKIAEAHDGN